MTSAPPAFLTAGPTTAPTKASWVPLVVGAAIVGGVLWMVATSVAPVLANPGRAKKLHVTAADVDPEQLRIGTEHEMEHTDSRKTARRIALDHLAETPDYYTRLATIEHNPSQKDPRTLTASQINNELDRLDAKRSKLNDEFIAAGRGNERASETAKLTDPLATRYNEVSDRQDTLRNEISLRYGPGAPSRLPRGFGPRVR